MHTPAITLASEFWVRHRWGLSCAVALVAIFAVWTAIAPFTPTLASVNSLWFVIGLCYVLGVFAYGFEGKLETAESCFPARLFVLPVRTSVLVAGPMLQGIAVAVLLWLGWEQFVLRPCGVHTATWWTPMLAAIVAVCQAIVWLPFGMPWLRILVAVVALIVLVRLPLFLALADVSFDDAAEEERLFTVLSVLLIPAAYLAAWAGVVRARRGDTPDWLRLVRSVHFKRTAQQTRTAFGSATRAQLWYEWRERGRGYVVTVAVILGLLLGLAMLFERTVGWHVRDNMILLIVPMMVAPLWGSYAGMSGEGLRSARLTTFNATRPLNNAGLVAAKFGASSMAVLAAWALVLSVVGVWFFYTGCQHELALMWQQSEPRVGRDRLIGGVGLTVFGLLFVTWRMMVVGLWAGLTGRVWVVGVQLFVFWSISFSVLYETALWNDLERRERLLTILQWIAGSAVAVKLAVAAWGLWTLQRRGEITMRTTIGGAATWGAIVAALFGVTAWLLRPTTIPTYGIALAVVLFVPLARLAVAPLALAWNRHR